MMMAANIVKVFFIFFVFFKYKFSCKITIVFWISRALLLCSLHHDLFTVDDVETLRSGLRSELPAVERIPPRGGSKRAEVERG